MTEGLNTAWVLPRPIVIPSIFRLLQSNLWRFGNPPRNFKARCTIVSDKGFAQKGQFSLHWIHAGWRGLPSEENWMQFLLSPQNVLQNRCNLGEGWCLHAFVALETLYLGWHVNSQLVKTNSLGNQTCERHPRRLPSVVSKTLVRSTNTTWISYFCSRYFSCSCTTL